MLKLEWNPSRLTTSDYVELLNLGFGGTWDETLYRWYMTRPFAGKTPDLAVLTDNGKPVSGAAVNYRQLRGRDGRIADVGVVCGAWTHPDARGKGHYTRVMNECAARVVARGGEVLLAFVTADNPSSKGLRTAGSQMVPSAYILSADEPAAMNEMEPIAASSCTPAELHAIHHDNASAAAFFYPSVDDWELQILQRPYPTEVLRIGSDIHAVVERTPDTDRLQWLSAAADNRVRALSALAARAHATGRKFFAFGTGAWTDACAGAPGLKVLPGFVTFLVSGPAGKQTGQLLADPWDIHSGDRM
jgi:GNAT superfamily N-acetyltransferase